MNADLIRRLRMYHSDLAPQEAADALEAAEALSAQNYATYCDVNAKLLARAESAEAEVARLREALSKRKMVMGEDGVLHLMMCEKCGESVGTSALHPARRDEGGSTE